MGRRSFHNPDVDSKPHFVKQHSNDDSIGMLHLYYNWPASAWQIATQLLAPADKVLGQAISDAEHPNTITKSSWFLLGPFCLLMACPDFDLTVDGPNTFEQVRPAAGERLPTASHLSQARTRRVLSCTGCDS